VNDEVHYEEKDMIAFCYCITPLYGIGFSILQVPHHGEQTEVCSFFRGSNLSVCEKPWRVRPARTY